MRRKLRFHSIRTRLICSVSLLLIGTFVFFWMANKMFLPTYYQYKKCQMMQNSYDEAYNRLNQMKWLEKEGKLDNDDSENSAQELALEKWSEDNNIKIYVVKLTTAYGRTFLGCRADFLYPSSVEDDPNLKDKIVYQIAENANLYNRLKPNKDDPSYSSVLYAPKDDKYRIIKMHDSRLDSDYLELLGAMEIGHETYTVYMRTNFESVQEYVSYSGQFLIYAVLGALVISAFFMILLSDNFTKPIRKLSKIAGEMSELQFEPKYTDCRYDEIGHLGHSINRLSEKLEQTIVELKTANNELQSDIENKIQIDEMRKEFLSNVTHELKTPIALIQGYAEGLQDNINEDAESREFYCDVIIDEANKMNRMVQKLLNLNQIEFGKNQVEFERFDVVQVIQSVLNSNQILMEQKEVQLVFETDEPVYVWADEYFTQEVLTNYVSNALHHVEGERKIEVRLEKKSELVRISVFNTGQQIPEEDLDKVWIKFYKVDKARTREYGGSGIGLSIVQAIMNSMHRDCGVCNREDGVEFWFELDMSVPNADK